MVTASLKHGLPVCHQLPGIQKLVLPEPVSGPTTLFRKGAPWRLELTWSKLRNGGRRGRQMGGAKQGDCDLLPSTEAHGIWRLDPRVSIHLSQTWKLIMHPECAYSGVFLLFSGAKRWCSCSIHGNTAPRTTFFPWTSVFFFETISILIGFKNIKPS